MGRAEIIGVLLVAVGVAAMCAAADIVFGLAASLVVFGVAALVAGVATIRAAAVNMSKGST